MLRKTLSLALLVITLASCNDKGSSKITKVFIKLNIASVLLNLKFVFL